MVANRVARIVTLTGLVLSFIRCAATPAAAQIVALNQNPLTIGSFTGPITYDQNTHTLTFSNIADVSQPMQGCSQYNGNGQCQGSPQTFYHTATGTVNVYNITKGTSASGSDQKTGAVMNASVSISADPGDVLSFSETQTIYCPMVAENVVNISALDFQIEIAFTMAQHIGGAPTNCKVLSGVTYCTFAAAPWCTPATTPPDWPVNGVQWAYANVQGYWLTAALCLSSNGHQPWACTPGIAFGEGNMQPKYSCTSNP